MSELLSRKGKIIISDQFIAHLNENADPIKALFSVFFPVGIEPYHMGGYRNDRVYFGYSELFDPIEESFTPPTYDVLFTQNEGEPISLEFKKITERPFG